MICTIVIIYGGIFGNRDHRIMGIVVEEEGKWQGWGWEAQIEDNMNGIIGKIEGLYRSWRNCYYKSSHFDNSNRKKWGNDGRIYFGAIAAMIWV